MIDARIRVAIVGAGMVANAGQIPAWQHVNEAEIVGVYNHHLGRATDTAARYGIAGAYDDLARMLDELQPDLAVVCTPNVSHRQYTIEALQAGAHVLCEKPVAASYGDAVAMYDAAETAGRTLYVGQTGRFSGAVMAAKALADAGELGEVYYAETASLRRRGVPTWGRFHLRSASGGGPLLDIGVHALDALLWIIGDPRVVAASGATYTKLADREDGLVTSLAESGAPVGVHNPRPYDPKEFDVEDLAAGMLRLENGATIGIKASWAANVPDGTGETLVLGTRGGLRFHPLTLIRNLAGYQIDVTPKVPPAPDIPFYGHWRQAAHVARVLHGQEPPMVTRDQVLNVMRALDGLYRSAELGREVRLD
ncbi:MAG: Gfo/Idh/MocA family protein [Anaerolineae bacterium]